MIRADLVVAGASEVVTCDPSMGEGKSGRIERGAVAIAGGKVAWVGRERDLAQEVATDGATVEVDASGRAVVPGFVDAHTHLIFAGERREEFAARAEGRAYEAQAGGIFNTAAATRAATTQELLRLTLDRAGLMLRHGTTTAEAKSGYALDAAGERRLLEILNEVDRAHALDLEITFLGAHAVPDEYRGRPDEFVDLVCEMLPVCAPLARWCDVFCDLGAFTPEQARRVLEAGKAAGLAPRIHAGELGPSGGAAVAAEVGAASADHLLFLEEAEAKALAAAGVTGVLCPATALGLGRFPDVAMMREQGMTIALASDLNPGTAYSESLQFAVAVATRAMRIGPEEALLGITRGGASALRRSDVGRLSPGCLGDLVVLAGDSALDLGYHAGINLVDLVIKRGVPQVI